MSPRRIDTLLQRELNGEITRIELEELDRLARLDPEVRRERRSWSRVTESFDDLRAPQPLNTAALAARVTREVRARGHRHEVRHPLAWMTGFAVAAMAAGAVFLVPRPEPTPTPLVAPPQVVEVRVARLGDAPPTSDAVPVEVDLGPDDDGAGEPVDIRF